MGIISPSGELCQFGFAFARALPRRGSRTEVLIPSSRSFDSASRNWWRYGDYLALRASSANLASLSQGRSRAAAVELKFSSPAQVI